MKAMRILIAALFAVVFTGAAVAKDTIAVLPFTGGTAEEGETIAELFSYNRELNAVFAPIPRTSITRAIGDEREFQAHSGMTDPSRVAAIGKQLGVQYIIAGNIAKLGNNNLLIISILKIDDLRQIAGDIQTYAKIEEIQGKLPDMARNIVEATKIDVSKLDKLAVIPVELRGNVDSQAADALAQILAINLIRSGKYAVYPRTATLEQVKEEYKNQREAGNTAYENRTEIGKGENPEFVLSVAARRLGSLNMFNASIVNLESGVQTLGGSVNYESLNDGIGVMESLTWELTGMIPPGLSLAQSLAWLNDNAAEGGDYTITLKNNESLAPQTLSCGGKTVNITLEGGSAERRISLSSNGSLFTVEKGVTLTLGANVTLQGRSANNASLVKVNEGGTLVLKDRAKITGNTYSSSSSNSFGGGVYVKGGTFTMEGGTISGNIASAYAYAIPTYGGGVSVSGGTFTMEGGTISGNTANSTTSSSESYAGSFAIALGGGVYVSGTFTMNGGIISDNTATANSKSPAASSVSRSYAAGGGVSVDGTFTMAGGTISSNTASNSSTASSNSESFSVSYGGGVSVSGGTFTMAGGTISGNTANSSSNSNSSIYGGGVFVYGSGTFTMAGGTISGNTASTDSKSADSKGGGVYVFGTFTKQSGGVIYGSNASASLKNTVTSGDANGHAVYFHISDSSNRKRNSTAGAGVTLNSNVSGSVGGWE
jgi:TolB-like protein